MIKIYDQKQIALLAEAGKFLAEVKTLLYQNIKASISTLELDHIAEQAIVARKCRPAFKGYNGFPYTICISINQELIHGLPSHNRILQEGDLVKVDVGLIYCGYYSDSAFTKVIGSGQKVDYKLIEVAKAAFEAGIKAIKPKARLGDIEHAIGQYVKSQGFYVASDYCGHGIGLALHEEPNVRNSGRLGTGPELKEGMVLAIEPMILQTTSQTKLASDGWTVLAGDNLRTSHYEHTIAIEANFKVKILTEGI